MAKIKTDNFIKGAYCNREYSWLQFNRRVLDQASDCGNPLLERCKFFAIFYSNLDEFFAVRLGSLLNEAESNPDKKDKVGLTAAKQAKMLSNYATELYKESNAAFAVLKENLSKNGIRMLSFKELSKGQKSDCERYFSGKVLPFLSPITVDAKRPFPVLENKRLYAVYRLEKDGVETQGVLPVPACLDRLYRLKTAKKLSFIALEDLVLAFGGSVFYGYTVKDKALVRVTKNADLELLEEDCDEAYGFDFSNYMREKVQERETTNAVRLEIRRGGETVCSFLRNALGVDKIRQYRVKYFLDYKFLFSLDRYFSEEKAAELSFLPFQANVDEDLKNGSSIIDKIFEKDLFLSYPFDGIEPLLGLLNECAVDKRVVSIKITVYRLAEESRIIDALVNARKNGKEVTAVVELSARFDEENNMRYAKILQDCGCTVIYGMGNYKVHSKILSVLLSDGGEAKYITHLGTGNYNETTAKQYTDLNVITANREIGEDAAAFFRNLAVCNTEYEYKKLWVAPKYLKSALIEEIEAQTVLAKRGKPARIVAKMNSLTDKDLMEKLIEASKNGVKISLIVRGICCLLPQIQGETENIEIISIVGRFLEHSRAYRFGDGEDCKLYLSSADWMTRNTEHRVEIAFPVLDETIKREILKMLDVMLLDNVKARKILPNGGYEKIGETSKKGKSVNSQEIFLT